MISTYPQTDHLYGSQNKFLKYAAAYHDVFSTALQMLLSPDEGSTIFDKLQNRSEEEKLRNQKGTLENQLKWEKEAIELMLQYDNIHLYSFFDEFDLITDLDNYKDENHYRQEVNSYILKCIHNGEHELTKDNYEEYCDKMWDFYTAYDYDSIFR